MTATVIFLTSGSTWLVPSDWNSADNTIQCVGSGADGAAGGTSSNTGGRGGGGGAYAAISNASLTPGSTVDIFVDPANGATSTWLKDNSGTKIVEAASGNGYVNGTTGASTGTTKYNGGTSYSGIGNGGNGGGGGGGPTGAGKPGAQTPSGAYGGSGGGGSNGGSSSAGTAGSGSTGGAGGNGTSGTGGGAANTAGTDGGGGGGGSASHTGGNGGADTAFDASHGVGGGGGGGNGQSGTTGYAGGNATGYGGGGGGGGRGNGSGGGPGGTGFQGIIVITYTPSSSGVSVELTGVAASPGAGSLLATGSAVLTLTGAAADPAAGSLSAKSILTVALAGVSASAGIGALVATGGAAATLTGVAASPGVGSMSVSVRVSVTLQGVAANPAAGNLFTNGMFDQTLISSPDKPGQFLVEIVAYQGSSAASGGAEAIAEIPFSSFPPGSSVATGPVTLRYSDRDWIGEPTDGMQPNVFYEGRVVTPLMMDTQAPLYPENERRVQRQFGMIEILNSDGEFDSIIQALSVDGRAVTVRFGPYMGSYSDFAVVASMLGAAWQPGEDMITLAVQDQVYTLDLPVQSNLYGGGGGADGTSDIQGKPKPLCYGEVSNITPVFLDPLNLIYQIHDGPVQSVDAVYDRGGALTLDTGVGTGGDVADYAALVSATVGASQFATCLAQGLFKIGSSPAGVITVDAKGDKTGGTYSNQIDDIATWIFEDRSNISASLIDTASFTSAAALGGPIGLYVDQNQTPTASQVIDTILQSIGGWWGAEISGKIKAGRIRIPETTAPDFYFDKFDLLTIAPEQMPIPRWRQRVAYAQNYTVQRGEDLDVAVTDARRQFLIEPYAIVTSSSATLQIRHPIAQDPAVVPTLLVNQSDAQTVCDYLQLLYGAERQIIRVTTKRLGLTVNLGACVNLTYPRFGLDGGKNFIVIGRSLDMDKQEIELRLWG